MKCYLFNQKTIKISIEKRQSKDERRWKEGKGKWVLKQCFIVIVYNIDRVLCHPWNICLLLPFAQPRVNQLSENDDIGSVFRPVGQLLWVSRPISMRGHQTTVLGSFWNVTFNTSTPTFFLVYSLFFLFFFLTWSRLTFYVNSISIYNRIVRDPNGTT